MTPHPDLEAYVAGLDLVDHHVHGALRDDPVDRADFERHIAETDRAGVGSWFDSQLGVAIRRWCAPVLDLEPLAPADDYLARRRELGADEVTRRLLAASGIGRYLLETGYRGDEILDIEGMVAASGRHVDEIVRLEAVAEELVRSGVTAAGFVAGYEGALRERARDAVGLKSILAYRYGFDVDPAEPSTAEVQAAADAWFAGMEAGDPVRVSDPVLLRFLIWTGARLDLPIQFHAGFGDPDLDLHRADPLLLTPLIRALEPRGTQIVLLHCYPYHRGAGYLARAFTHVSFDVGLAINYLGARAGAVVAESLELAPFDKVLFSSDAWGPAELHHLGASLWRRTTTDLLSSWVRAGDWTLDDAKSVARRIAGANAERVYRLEAR
jgi:predicted TIM-barrel fold metal-dependent hydrolase